jgi:superfamily II DNA or RNA helicase
VYSTGDKEPIEFFFNALTESNQFDLGLGYFSSTGINVLSAGFAYFIHKGGKVRIIINDFLSQKDKDAIIEGTQNHEISFEQTILNDITSLAQVLSNQDKHFFKCLSYLISKNRIEFIAVVPKSRKGGIAHNKYGIFRDEENNKVVFNGSANFSKNALLNNVESISCYKSWAESQSDLERLNYFEDVFNKTWNGEWSNVQIISIDKVKSYIQTTFPATDSKELLEEEMLIAKENQDLEDIIINRMNDIYEDEIELKKEPAFPFPGGAREYQKNAYERWVKNKYQGLFAMATGTGKTITSLNCVLEEYHKTGKYKILILVPTRALVQQWISEVKKFNFGNIHSTQENGWFDFISNYFLSSQLGIENNLVFISTYQSFNGDKFQKISTKSGWDEFILIADEAHNMGSARTLLNLPNKILRRIGLSATPERVYDDSGSNEIYKFFNSYPPCFTYSYSMYKAIYTEPASLVKYYYFPYFSSLDNIELEEYRAITEKLIQNYDSKSGEFSEYGKRLLIMRKRIINQAKNKINTLNEIFIDVRSKEGDLKYTFVYVPEGNETDYSSEDLFTYDSEERRLIKSYGEAIRQNGYTTHELLSDTKNRDRILSQFSEGKIDVLLAMKILDEGVDIPATKNAVFCASTGNPRQYIQRRGRVLRKSKDKSYANIYDIIIAPQDNYIDSLPPDLKAMEIRIFRNELNRVANFIYAAENRHQVLSGRLGELGDKFGIDLIELIESNLKIDNDCNK